LLDAVSRLCVQDRRYRIKVTINADGTWSYDEDTVLMIRGKTEPFHHTDRNTLTKVAEPTPNRWPAND